MNLNHIALVCSSAENADRFFQTCLGLKKTAIKNLSAEISEKLFNRTEAFQMLYYSNDSLAFEIFVSEQTDRVEKSLGHVCIDVRNREAFIEKCQTEELEVLKIPKGDSLLVFIKDYDGNAYEIKERNS
ncbi:MAG: VOC family protein [Deltaproteobacteria bacterium]|jgi:catechol 2,3-dioxygenase-like lactoylglutathione lyase family enzyme|nr:VOC family protein [Deltaproteobacteria bacterium]MBT4643631.1 VOC family protein [Deltaproteobacteria bacterium]